SVESALAIARESEDAKFLAGGHTLIPTMKARLAAPAELIDLAHIEELRGVTISGNMVTIGAMTPHATVASNAELAAICPALCHPAGHIVHPHLRHRGTIGGSTANNDPAADYPAALLALAATIVTDRRQIPAEDFFVGLFETALEEDEIITAITFTAPDMAGYAKFPNPASRYAMTGVFVARRGDDVRVAVTGAGDDGVFRAEAIETALSDRFDPAALEGVTVPADRLMSDIHASAEYRAHLIPVMARRAVTAALRL